MKNLILIIFLCLPAALAGCGATPATKAAQGEKILIQTVNDGMQEWAAYVKAGKASPALIQKIKTLYNAYYDAQQVAKAAIEKSIASAPGTSPADVDTANQAVKNAEQALLSALNQILRP